MLNPTIPKNEKLARILIITVSVVVFVAVVMLGRVQLNIEPGFDVHVFAKANAVINSIVSLLLIAGMAAVRSRNYLAHKRIMLSAMIFSVLFLISYIAHHLLAGDTRFGGVGAIRYVYFFILITHIILAALILPFILFTTYRGLTGEWAKHRRIARYTWPVWLYVSITGVIVYLMISPYYT
jgi:putative membrane protein